MASFRIEGGRTLGGEITPQGAKNEALQVLCATALTAGEVTMHNVPDIRDVNLLIEALQFIGVEVVKLGGGSWKFSAANLKPELMLTEGFRKKATAIRGSVMLVGPMLARYGISYMTRPGGDKIGRRRLDTHVVGLQSLGAQFSTCSDSGVYCVTASDLRGAYMLLDEASVTGTANIVMAAVMANGTTTIFNAACEPYVTQLCRMLNKMGAHISGVGSNLLTIEGVNEMHGCSHTLLPDMIEVGSFIGMAAMTKSAITIRNTGYDDLGIIPEVFRRLGIIVQRQGDDIFIPTLDHYEVESFMDGGIMTISDAPWPGFTPDLISIALVTAVQARGSVLIHQKMFESRLFFTDKLIDMGAKIILCDPHRATVIGHDHEHRLRGIRMSSPDIRAGVALLIAALSADGVSIIDNIEQIDRGYQNIDGRLNALGACIERI
ncbi:MAG TPA: UDP-N-acetylglucosamine 1-carboxyvinyltransferase [Bacteroidales bacterium]|nr:MAG: UDP-N-acetylglucosamine 1-carboxyvinyltransferase [Bacteroidetes bacterium GWE2_42_24]OFY31703.1 MAG: UDP-N-acetylglucosamine 1-carboxyvinyltransferase [Bacteroidetes bacterium GWF2_43_11]HAQ65804.1 UDP-N-acetylglucosamine 1-carboxyvinyltransferase [Bacteroidales bacterium]HBZ67032.1 UDP-N-acetylglucosamine 1-carboxyvinyltransferase [Bacteroidales bacterium]